MSTTATINGHTTALAAAKSVPSLPVGSTLLPRIAPEDNGDEHPPIYLKLNPSILALLADPESPANLSLELSDRTKALRIGNYEYQGSMYKEPGYLEVYLPEEGLDGFSDDHACFRSAGQVRNRIAIKQDRPVKIAPLAGAVDLSQPTEQRIIQLLALGPAYAHDLAAKTQASRELVDAVLARVAEPRLEGSSSFVLKREFQPRQTTSKDDSDDVTLRDDTQLAPAKPERITKTLKELRDAASVLNSEHSGRKTVKPGREQTPSSGLPAPAAKGLKLGAQRSSSLPPEPASDPAHRSSLESLKQAKRRSAAPHETHKRFRSEAPTVGDANDSDEDMFEIARKFKSAYGEYLELYSLLSKRKARPPSQVEKLMTMHRQLERWKNTLWLNARNKRMVN